MATVPDIFESMDYGPAPEGADDVKAWLASQADGFSHFINGIWQPPAEGAFLDTLNPASGEVLGRIAVGSEADVNAAVQAARNAFESWSSTGGHARARVLYALARLIQKNSRFLAILETLDNGKPIRETRDIDIPLSARHFYHHAGWAQLMDREVPDHEPLGVVGQIIPWNFPFLMLAWKIAPAIATGNCVVLKPAEYTSLTALYFAHLCREAGVPPGVVNIVTGAGQTGSVIVDHPDVNKIAFTGSTAVGRLIRERTAGSGKALTLELGGKSPFIVFDDADMDSAVEGLVDAIWFNQGEVCCAGSRLLIEEGVADRLIGKIKTRLESFRVGDPLDKTVDMGAVVDPVQYQRISELVEQGRSEGAEVWQPNVPMPQTGCFYPPTVLTGVSPSNTAVREEIFGPVLTAMTFRTLKEAISLANNTRYGLAASIWSENINRALEAASLVHAGVVWINTTNQFDAAAGFGGYRESGFGREGGFNGLFEYLKPRDEWTDDTPTTLPLSGPGQDGAPVVSLDPVDRTPKHFIGGKQVRPDNGRTDPVLTHDERQAGRIAQGSRKDIRDAVEAAFKADGWSRQTTHNRAQILYYIAENFSARAEEFERRLMDLTGLTATNARTEVEQTISRLFAYGAWADKFEGRVHTPPQRSVVLAVHEPIGVLGIVCPDERPLLSFVSLFAPAMAMGNRCVVVPSERYPLLATDFYQVLETSDVPPGVVNIVTGPRTDLLKTLGAHDQVEGLWCFSDATDAQTAEKLSAPNLKQTWTNSGRGRDWNDPARGEGRDFLRNATQVKTIWLPYGD